MKTNDILENMNSKDKPLFLDMDDAHNAINSNILKQTMLSQETRDRDDGILAASNGKHENGDADYDYSDLGPETDVDAVDDVGVPVENDSNHEKDSNLLDNLRIEQPEINAKRQLDAENNLREDEDEDRDDDDKVLDKYPASESVLEAAPRRIPTNHPSAVFKLGENYEDYYGMERFVDYDDFPPSSDANRPLQPALVPGADNVADSEDSEDEWNYYPNKEKDPVDEPQEAKTEGEIESPELPIEDNELKIQSEDIGEGIKCETPKEEQSQLINTEISAESGAVESDQEEKLFAKEQEESKNMDFPLNPDAAEFVPVSPQFRGPRMNLSNDYPISGSPLKQVPQMDDIQVPSQSEFEEEVCQRPREVEPEEREYQNGVNSQPTDDADFINDRPKVHGFGANLDDSEISSMKAEFGDESSTSFLTATDFHRTGVSTVDESFSSSERDYDIAKDPMAMSFTPSDFEAAFDKAVDLNAVHNLSNTDLDDKNGMIEEEGFTAQSPEPHPELTTLASPEAEQPTHTPAFLGESAELVNLSSQQEDSEATFIEHTDETKANVDFLNLQSESSQLDQQETAKSDHSPLTENYSAEFESEKEAVSIDNEPILTPSSIEIDETKPMDETSEDAVPLEACSRQEVSIKEADTPASISPVPEAMETDVLAPAENTEVSSKLLSALDADAPKFTPGYYNFSPTESNDVCKPSLAKTNDVCEPPHIETSNICESSPLETSNICESSPLETSNIICESSPVETSDISKPTNTEISNVCESSSVQASDVCQSYLVDSSNDFQPSLVETSNVDQSPLIEESNVDQSPLIEESNVDQSPFVETTNIYQSSLVDTNNDEVCEFSSMKSSNVCEPVSHNLVFGMQPPEEKAVESIPTQSGQDNLLDFAEEEEVCVKKVVEVESTPPPSPQNSEEKVSQNVDDMICSIKSALEQKVDDVVESKEEAPVDADIFEFKTHVTEEPMKADVLNLSESMAELRLSSLKSELLTKSEDTLVSSFDQQLQEEVPQKEELIAAREPEQPSAPEAEEYKIEAETKVEEVSSAIKEPPVEKAAEISGNKVAKAAAVTAVAAGVVAGAVVAQSKTKTKPTAAKPSKTTATKTAQKSTPTSPSKTIISTTRTSTAAAKKPTTTRPKDLDAAKKTTVSSTTSSKVPATKPVPKTTSATSVTKSATRPNTGSVAAKAKPTSTTAKTTVSDKKPTANGDIKSLNKVDTATAKPPISKTTSAPKAASAKTTTARMLTATTTTTSTKTRPASAVAATKSATTTTKTSISATTTSTLSSRPKSTSTAGKVTKSRVLTPKSSPIIDKQVKETANKQISMARSSTVTKTTRVSTSNTTTTTAKRASMTAKTTSTASPIKKLTATSKISNRTSTPGKTTTQKEKVVQNGVSEKVEMNAIIDDVPKKDLSPVVTPNDNQLIMSSD